MVGVRRRGSRDPALVSDRWHIGSCTKTFTAALWGRLVELGHAEWDMPLGQALADLDGDMHPDWTGQTVDSVFWCRAGFKANLSPDQMQQAWDDSRPLADQRTDAARQALGDPPDRPDEVRYSNLGLIVVGAAIDRLAGATFEQALDTHVLAPLGIESAGFGPPGEIWGHPARFRFGDFGHPGRAARRPRRSLQRQPCGVLRRRNDAYHHGRLGQVRAGLHGRRLEPAA